MNAWSIAWKLTCFRLPRFITSVLIWIINGSVPLATGLLVKAIFDRLSNNVQVSFNIWMLVALFAGSEIVSLLSGFGTKYFVMPFWLMSSTLVRKNLLKGILLGPGSRSLPGSSGEAISRFRSDPDSIVYFIDRWTDVVWSLSFIVVALIIMIRISWLITLVAFSPMMIIRWLTQWFDKPLKVSDRHNREADGQVTSFLGEIFGSIVAIKVAGAEKNIVKQYRKINKMRSRAKLRNLFLNDLVNSLNFNVVQISVGMVMVLCANLIETGAFTIGDFVLFVSYLSMISSTLFWAGALLTTKRQATVSIERMTLLLPDHKPEKLVEHGPIYLKETIPPLPETVKQQEHILESLYIENLTYHYPGTNQGINHIHLHIKRGERIVIVGRIGSGKTTLVRTLLGLLAKKEGKIVWNETLVEDPATYFIPPRCAYTPQIPRLFSESLKENILLGMAEEKVHLPTILRQAVLESDISTMKEGLDTMIGTRGVRLSGGQIQRSAIARMLVHDTDFMVLDDVSSAIDIETEKKLWNNIRQHQEKTYLIVSHRQLSLMNADRIIVLKDGKIVGEGSLNDLIANNEEMKLLWQGELQ